MVAWLVVPAAPVGALFSVLLVALLRWADADAGALRLVAEEAPPPAEATRWVRGADALAGLFETQRFDLSAVRDRGAAVPRLYLATLPQDLAAIVEPERRKEVFLKTALPLVLEVNETIRAERAQLEAVREKLARGYRVSYAESLWLDDLARRYGVDGHDLSALLLRVDEIPPALALAQAAAESGWGTSRIARKGNALFGQKTWGTAGIEPLARQPGETHRYAAFERLLDGFAAYARNLNTHPAYADFRARRAALRAAGARLDGEALAATLTRYSTRGGAYVADLQAIIRRERLTAFDGARLDESGRIRILVPAI